MITITTIFYLLRLETCVCQSLIFWEELARCLKITESVSFKIASEASYVYILSGQKFIKNAKNGSFWRVFENSQTVLPNKSFNRTKICGKCQNSKIQTRHFESFSNNVELGLCLSIKNNVFWCIDAFHKKSNFLD